MRSRSPLTTSRIKVSVMASRSPKLSRASRVTRRPLLAACSAKGKRAKAVDMLTHERLLLEEVEGVDFRILDRMARFGSLAGMSRVRLSDYPADLTVEVFLE